MAAELQQLGWLLSLFSREVEVRPAVGLWSWSSSGSSLVAGSPRCFRKVINDCNNSSLRLSEKPRTLDPKVHFLIKNQRNSLGEKGVSPGTSARGSAGSTGSTAPTLKRRIEPIEVRLLTGRTIEGLNVHTL